MLDEHLSQERLLQMLQTLIFMLIKSDEIVEVAKKKANVMLF